MSLDQSNQGDLKSGLGWISFLNLHPLRCELKKKFPEVFLPKIGTPAEINKLLMNRQILLAPSSSICLFKDPTLEIATPVGIVSRGPVESVYLGIKKTRTFAGIDLKLAVLELGPFIKSMISEEKDPQKISKFICGDWRQDLKRRNSLAPQIKLSKQSETSVMLARIFYAIFFGATSKEFDDLSVKAPQSVQDFSRLEDQPPCLELVIGDEALRRKDEFEEIIDLGLFWQNLTGLPFVYAVWQKSAAELPAKLQAICDKLPEIASRCEKKMRVDPSVYFEKSYSPLNDNQSYLDPVLYWQKLYYTIDSSAMLGLVLFLTLAKDLCSLASNDHVSLQLLKLSGRCTPDLSRF